MSGLSGRTPGAGRPRFGGRPVGKQRTRRFMLTIGFSGVAVLLVMGYLSFNVANTVPGRAYYDVYAEFNEADNLANHYEVRIGGRRAGQVLKPEVRDGRARVKLRLDEEFGPLKTDTRTSVRLRSAVGVRYLDVTPGTKGKDIPENGLIPASQQDESVPLDAVLGTFDEPTRRGVQFFLSQFGGAFAGNGGRINEALASAAPFFEDLGSLSEEITRQPDLLKRLINGTGRTFATLDAVRDPLVEGFRPVANAARDFAATRDGFTSTFEVAPPALDTLAARLPSVNRLVNEVDALARQGRPTLDALPRALSRTNVLLRDAQPSLREADDTLGLVETAAPPVVRFLRTLQTQLPDVDDLIASLSPVVKYINPRTCELVNFTTGWSNSLKWGTSRGSEVQFRVTLSNLNGSGFLGGTPPKGLFGLGGEGLGQDQSTSYPGPCQNGEGNTGPEGVTVEESAKGLTYTYDRPPGIGLTGKGTK